MDRIILAPSRTDITDFGLLLLSGRFHLLLKKIITLFAVEMVCSIISNLSFNARYIKPQVGNLF